MLITLSNFADRKAEYLRNAPAPAKSFPRHMVWIPDGDFLIGSDAFYPEEKPQRPAAVTGFWMDTHPVTNSQFQRFVRQTAYVTTAERGGDAAANPGIDPSLLEPGGMVFKKSPKPIPLRDARQWWGYVIGANWKLPFGGRRPKTGGPSHPVVQVSYLEALA